MRLERDRKDGRRDFWEATVEKKSIEITAGIVNIKHKRETKVFASRAEAVAALDKLVAAKRKVGFAEPRCLDSQFLPTPIPTNPMLEAGLRAAKDD